MPLKFWTKMFIFILRFEPFNLQFRGKIFMPLTLFFGSDQFTLIFFFI